MELSEFDRQYVRVTLSEDEAFEGECAHNSEEYNEHEYGVVEEGLQIEDWLLWKRQIRRVERLPEKEGSPYRHYRVLRTPRLTLRPWTDADAEACFRLASDPRVGPPAGWPPHLSLEETKTVIREVLAVPECFAITLNPSGELIGSIALKLGRDADLVEDDYECELGYWLGVPYWGRGYMTEAGREILRYAFEELCMEKVWCGRYEGNERSARVQEKLGLRPMWVSENVEVPRLGEVRRGYVRCLTRAQWDAENGRS